MIEFFKIMGEASEKSGKKVKISFEFVGEVLKQEDTVKEDVAKEVVKEVAKEAPQILTEYVEAVDLNKPFEQLELDSFVMDLQVTEELEVNERTQFPPCIIKKRRSLREKGNQDR